MASAVDLVKAKPSSEIALSLDCDNNKAKRASHSAATISRRDFAAHVYGSTWFVAIGGSCAAVADVTDETELYANSSPDSAYSTLKNAKLFFLCEQRASYTGFTLILYNLNV